MWEARRDGSFTESEANYRVALIRRSARHADEMRAQFENAALWWVTKEMCQVAMDASQDLPWADWTTLLPTTSGVVDFARPLPPVYTPAPVTHSTGNSVLVPPFEVDILGWWTNAHGELHIEVFGFSQRLGHGIQAGPFQHVLTLCLDSETAVHDEFRIISRFSKRNRNEDALERSVRASHIGIRALLATVFTLMDQPVVASTSTLGATAGLSDPSPGNRERRADDVLLVDAAPIHYMPGEMDKLRSPGSRRRPAHRWMVRGHWRNQAYGADRSLRRQQWIPDHVRGPEGAPLIDRDHVYVWRE